MDPQESGCYQHSLQTGYMSRSNLWHNVNIAERNLELLLSSSVLKHALLHISKLRCVGSLKLKKMAIRENCLKLKHCSTYLCQMRRVCISIYLQECTSLQVAKVFVHGTVQPQIGLTNWAHEGRTTEGKVKGILSDQGWHSLKRLYGTVVPIVHQFYKGKYPFLQYI